MIGSKNLKSFKNLFLVSISVYFPDKIVLYTPTIPHPSPSRSKLAPVLNLNFYKVKKAFAGS